MLAATRGNTVQQQSPTARRRPTRRARWGSVAIMTTLAALGTLVVALPLVA